MDTTPATTTTRTRRVARSALGLGLVAALSAGTTAALTGSAEALPAYAKSCAFGLNSFTTTDGWKSAGLVATVKNGSAPRQVVAQLASDAGVDTLAEIRVGWSVDGGPVQEHVYGPGNFANHDEYWETRMTMAVIPMGAGTHTVQPFVRISGANGKNGVLGSRCLTVESRTS